MAGVIEGRRREDGRPGFRGGGRRLGACYRRLRKVGWVQPRGDGQELGAAGGGRGLRKVGRMQLGETVSQRRERVVRGTRVGERAVVVGDKNAGGGLVGKMRRQWMVG